MRGVMQNCASRDPEILQGANHRGAPMVFCNGHNCYEWMDREGKDTEVPTEAEVKAYNPEIGRLLFPGECLLIFTFHKL